MMSRFIQFQTWGPYSHASWILEDDSCIEAWHKGGVRHTRHWSMDHTPGTPIDLFEVKGLTAEQRAGIESFLLSQVGKRYDYRGVTRFVTRLPPVDQMDRWFCSVLVFMAVASVRAPLLARIPSHKVNPTLLSYAPDLRLTGTHKTWRMESEYYPIIIDAAHGLRA
jgi:hypothetical protein